MSNSPPKNQRVSSKLGMPPGTLLHIGEKKTDPPSMSVINYDVQSHVSHHVSSGEEAIKYYSTSGITWVNIDGLQDTTTIEQIGTAFGISPLTLEDILNTHQRPKLDEYDDYLYVVVKMLHYPNEQLELEREQVSFLLGYNFVLSFQESPGDTFAPVRSRLQQKGSALRAAGSDYLLYSLLDTIVDNYFAIIERLSDKTEVLEEQILHNPHDGLLNEVYWFKKEIAGIRRSIYPLREVIATLDRNESSLITASTRWLIRDIYDHTIQIVDNIENFRETTSTMIDLYMSGVSNRMNNIMKVLTVISTIFIPLTFIVGVYGMNFKHMPELEYHYAYFEVWGVMIVLTSGMVWYFRHKKWF